MEASSTTVGESMKLSKEFYGRLATVCIFIFFVIVINLNLLNAKKYGEAYSLDAYTSFIPFVGEAEVQNNLLFVDIDEESLTKLGQWPWPRVILADLVSKISSAGPAVVGLDMLLSEVDRFNPKMLSQIMNKTSKNISDIFIDGDEVLEKALLNTPTVLATILHKSEKNIFKNNSNFIIKNTNDLEIREASGVISPIEKLKDATGYGFVNIDSENIGNVVRYLPMLAIYDGSVIPSFVLEIIRIYEEASDIEIKKSQGVFPYQYLGTGFFSFPIQRNADFVLHHGSTNSISILSAQSILEEEFELSLLENKIIIIGSSAVGLNDLKNTNLEKFVPGGMILLSAINQILNERHLLISTEINWITVSILMITLFLLIFSSIANSILFGLIYTIITSLSFILICLYIFDHLGIVVNLIYIFSYMATCLLWLCIYLIINSLRKRELVVAFGQYLNPEMVRSIERSGKRPELGGLQRQVTVMFVDVRGFSEISEKLISKPQVLAAGINTILENVSDCIQNNFGTVDKFMGDCVMAFWNAPLYQSNHAELAVKAASEIEKMVPMINKLILQRAGAEWPVKEISIGVGIATGDVVVGNFGSQSRLSYSVIGDTVNLAARIESFVKETGITTTVCEATARLSASKFLIEMDSIEVRGRVSKEKVFGLYKFTDEEETIHNKILEARLLENSQELRECLNTVKPDSYPESLLKFYNGKVEL